MLETQTTLVGFTLINGTVVMQVALLFGAIYNCVRYPDAGSSTYLNLTPQEKDVFNQARFISIPASHITLIVCNLVTGSTRLQRDGVKQIFAFGGMLISLNLVFAITRVMFFFPQPVNYKADPRTSAIFIWMTTELYTFIATVVSNVLFLALRSCIHHKIQLDKVPERKQLPAIDTIVAITEVAAAFNSVWIPFLVSVVIFVYPNDTNQSNLFPELCTIFFGGFISAPCVLFMIFVHWKKGSPTWQKIAPFIMVILFYTSYLVIPIVNIVVFVYYVVQPSFEVRDEPITSYMVCYMVLYTCRVVEFFVWIRKTIMDDAKIHLMNRERDAGKSLEELQEELEAVQCEAKHSASAISRLNTLKFLVNEKLPYMKRTRGYGQGEMRIGKPLDFTEDIFSLCFVVQLEDNLLDPLFDCVKGKLLCEEAQSSDEDEEEGPPTEGDNEQPKQTSTSLESNEKTPLVQPSLNAVIDEDEQLRNEVSSSRLDQEQNPYDDDPEYEAPRELEVHNWTDQYQERVKIVKLQRRLEIKHTKRVNFFLNATITFLFQMTLIVMIIYELRYNPAYANIIVCEAKRPIMYARFICTIILHLSLCDVITQGLVMMKYALNHTYRFENYLIAFAAGFYQMVGSLGVEFSNIGVICAANDTISIVFNFIAVAIIADFDNYVFDSLKNESFKQLLDARFTTNAFPICHTTSKKCKPNELSKVEYTDPERQGTYRPLNITMSQRTIGNKTLYFIYRILRTFYVSMFYYFLPFLTVIGSIMFPLYSRGNQPQGCQPY